MIGNKIIEPFGWCKGVEDALIKFDNIIKNNANKKIYVIGDLIHNKQSLEKFIKSNVFFLKSNIKIKKLDKLDNQAIIIFSTHGCIKKTKDFAIKKFSQTFDLTCPIILKNIKLTCNLTKKNETILYFGKKNHDETKCMLSQNPLIKLIRKEKKLKLITSDVTLINQTTMPLNYNINNPHIKYVSTTCNFVKQRIENINKLNHKPSILLVVGDKKSNNTQKLVETAKKQKIKTILVINTKQLKHFKEKDYLITSGTSTSKDKVLKIQNYLEDKIG